MISGIKDNEILHPVAHTIMQQCIYPWKWIQFHYVIKHIEVRHLNIFSTLPLGWFHNSLGSNTICLMYTWFCFVLVCFGCIKKFPRITPIVPSNSLFPWALIQYRYHLISIINPIYKIVLLSQWDFLYCWTASLYWIWPFVTSYNIIELGWHYSW